MAVAVESLESEADSCFARVFTGQDVVQRLFKVWGQKASGFGVDNMGFLSSGAQHAQITGLKLVAPS